MEDENKKWARSELIQKRHQEIMERVENFLKDFPESAREGMSDQEMLAIFAISMIAELQLQREGKIT